MEVFRWADLREDGKTLGIKLINKFPGNRVESLETELAKEPLVLAELVSLFELVLDLFSRLLPESGIAEAVLVDEGLVHHHVNRVTSRHHVVEVDHADERLDLAALRPFKTKTTFPCFKNLPIFSAEFMEKFNYISR